MPYTYVRLGSEKTAFGVILCGDTRLFFLYTWFKYVASRYFGSRQIDRRERLVVARFILHSSVNSEGKYRFVVTAGASALFKMQISRNAIIKRARIESAGYSASKSRRANNPGVNLLRLSAKFIRSDSGNEREREGANSGGSYSVNSSAKARAYTYVYSKFFTRALELDRHAAAQTPLEILFTMRWLSRGQLIQRLIPEYPFAILMLAVIKFAHSKISYICIHYMYFLKLSRARTLTF